MFRRTILRAALGVIAPADYAINRFISIFVLAWITAPLAPAGVKVLTLQWNELSAAVAKQVVTVELTRHIRLQGAILEVGPDKIRMAIQSSSDKKTFPPGEGSVSRKEIAEIRIKRLAGPGRLIGAAGIGAAASLGSLSWAISDSRVNVSDGARIAQWAAITAGRGRRVLGRQTDRQQRNGDPDNAGEWKMRRRRPARPAGTTTAPAIHCPQRSRHTTSSRS